MISSRLPEAMNAAWLVVSVCMVVVFLHYVIRCMRQGMTPSMQAASVFLIYFAGEAWQRIWIALWRHWKSEGYDVDWMVHTWPVAVGVTIAVIGALIGIYVFTRALGHWPWIVSAVAAITAALLASA